MKKAILAAVLFASIGAAQAQDQGVTLAAQVQVSPSKTMDISHARYINTTPGNQYIIDGNGNKHAATFRSLASIFNNTTFYNFQRVSGDLYQNVSASISIDCANGTLITWNNGSVELRNDGCAFNDSVKVRSR